MVGESARRVYSDGRAMLKRVIDGRWITANAVVSFLPANTVNDDDIEIYTDESRSTRSPSPGTTCASRSPSARGSTTSAWPISSRPRRSMACPRASRITSGCSR
ncbi:MAG: hypothetical protein IPM01_21560 [Burkholderiaceae bacterium]|nr:hypothetical protein [Burkholderiaceae bacterium]